MSLKHITQVKHGDTIKLQKSNGIYAEFWVVNQTVEGVKVLDKTPISDAFDDDGTQIFSPTDTNNIGHTLNNLYYNTLSADTKSMLVRATWYTGFNINETSRNVKANVGLLTRSEWMSANGNTRYGGKIPYLATDYEWTITPMYDIPNSIFHIRPTDGVVNQGVTYSYNTQPARPALVLKSDLYVDENGRVISNVEPLVTLTSPIDAQILYENDTLSLAGSVTDTNVGDIVSVKFSINGGEARAILASVSSGSAMSYAKNLTYKSGMLYDGATAITGALTEGSQHTLKVWAEDDKGGKSSEITRSFYVVPNRAATLSLDAFVTRTGLINTDVVNITGKVADLDNGNVIVKYKIGNGAFVQVYNGPATGTPTPFNFNVLLADLAEGANQITIQAVDAYNAITQQVLSLTKTANEQPLLTAVTYYEITPPNGATDGLQLYIERELGDLVVSADVFMGASGETEVFVPMTLASTANLTNGNVEDTFSYQHSTDATKVVIRINMSRASAATNKAIKKISGVLT